MRRSVAVVGGGLGGMAAAGELARKGHAVTLFEASRLGGKAQSGIHGGTVLDLGPTLLTMPGVVRQAFARNENRSGRRDLDSRAFAVVGDHEKRIRSRRERINYAVPDLCQEISHPLRFVNCDGNMIDHYK